MLFNSVEFLIFFLILIVLCMTISHTWQNRILLIASYIFYCTFDWRFLSLILISTSVDFCCGLRIYSANDGRKKRAFLLLSIMVNMLILGFFKYFNFFVSAVQTTLSSCGLSVSMHTLNIILPLGISYYTLKTMSYPIEVYRGLIKPATNFFDYALFVAFFPLLLAGPIERPQKLLPQILFKREITLTNLRVGSFLIFWGLFQKVFVADNLAKIVDALFYKSPPYNGFHTMLAIYSYTFQILYDFAGYSNMARGIGKCLGFDIMINFNLPYFVSNPSEFWRRWHISLSMWLRDYVYIPLGGSRYGTLKTCRNLALTMLVCGLWHGAAWTFILWGCYHGMLLVVSRLYKLFFKTTIMPSGNRIGVVWGLFKTVCFFQFIAFGWLIFRAESVGQVKAMCYGMLYNFSITAAGLGLVQQVLFFLCPIVAIDFICRNKNDIVSILLWPQPVRCMLYAGIFYCLFFYGVASRSFIYFQF
jgi:alginate O-acetyltransferase complex protein AlgI